MNEYEKQLLIANIKESLISKIINIDLERKKNVLFKDNNSIFEYREVLDILKLEPKQIKDYTKWERLLVLTSEQRTLAFPYLKVTNLLSLQTVKASALRRQW